MDVGSAQLAAHGHEYGSEVPAAESRLRNAGLHARGAKDGFAERTLASGDLAHWSAGRGHLPEPHDHGERAHPPYGLLQHYRFRMAVGETPPRNYTEGGQALV